MVAKALLIPSGQDPLARGIQSKQVGVGWEERMNEKGENEEIPGVLET